MQRNKIKTLDEALQKIEELSAGVLMIAELLNMDVPKGTDDSDLISQIAAIIEEKQQAEQNRIAAQKAREREMFSQDDSEYQTIKNNLNTGIAGV
ncbi:MAG: hypothetical protein NC311_11320 [Muribaculaceae bacterium]|nr:hypothetical protein [Muribaculaceae bacterium]